jgi:predicted TPR repeat methyltransferase
LFTYLINDASVGISPKMPGELVEKLFDEYARDFETHLRERLRYRLPEQLFEVMAPHLEALPQALQMLDLGCGTGLMAPLLKPRAHHLIGVDLSPKMLAMAAEKQLYDELVKAEIETYLADSGARFDVIVAADVFIYFGLLGAPLASIASCLEEGGVCAFSVESCEEGNDFHLTTSGRYAHRRDYVERCCEEAGLQIVECRDAVLRLEHGRDTEGYLFVSKRAAPGNAA